MTCACGKEIFRDDDGYLRHKESRYIQCSQDRWPNPWGTLKVYTWIEITNDVRLREGNIQDCFFRG
jgi:hypothetical protein